MTWLAELASAIVSNNKFLCPISGMENPTSGQLTPLTGARIINKVHDLNGLGILVRWYSSCHQIGGEKYYGCASTSSITPKKNTARAVRSGRDSCGYGGHGGAFKVKSR